MTPPFSPRLALASLSGESDATWARAGSAYAGAAFLGGIAVDEPTREAARRLVARDRTEFLPPDPVAFVDAQLAALGDADLRPGVNVRAASAGSVRPVAEVCAVHDAMLEVNAHCRQAEMCATGAGQRLLLEPDRLRRQVAAAADAGCTVGVKVRTEVEGVDLPAVARAAETAGADLLHVDAMDSEPIVADLADVTDCFLVANNGVRDEPTTREYLQYGADAVSVGRPSDDPDVLARVAAAVDSWFESTDSGADRAV